MDGNLSDALIGHVEKMFTPTEIEQAKDLLLQITKTGSGGQTTNRCEIAALKISCGSIKKLMWAVELYHSDFRDLLMSAGFGHDINAHERWISSRI
jgi:hypothetical protein